MRDARTPKVKLPHAADGASGQVRGRVREIHWSMQPFARTRNVQKSWRRVPAAWLPLAVAACTTLPEAPIPAPSGAKSALVVFDIDGTLTPHNLRVHEARPAAAEAVQSFASQGYEIVYITARVPAFQASLPAWLGEHGFPPGNLHVAQSREERRNPADFKTRVLNGYVAQGWRLAYGFGDSTTDFIAYQRAGLAGDRVFALKRQGQAACEEGVYHACLDNWDDARPFVVVDPPRARDNGPAIGVP